MPPLATPPHLPFPPLVEGRFRARPNRFVAIVDLPGRGECLAHVPTTGRMGELLVPGARVLLATQDLPHRKTHLDLLLVEGPAGLVCIDARVPNRLLSLYWTRNPGPTGLPVRALRPEPRHGQGRFDFMLEDAEGSLLVEVKSVTLVREGCALFPDAPTVRGARHLRELAALSRADHRTAVVFVVQRSDAGSVRPNEAADPSFAAAAHEAKAAGVMLTALAAWVSPQGVTVAGSLPFSVR